MGMAATTPRRIVTPASHDGEGSVEHAIDGREREPIAVDHPGLFELASHPRHEEHRLAVRPTSGVRVWAISFAAGVP